MKTWRIATEASWRFLAMVSVEAATSVLEGVVARQWRRAKSKSIRRLLSAARVVCRLCVVWPGVIPLYAATTDLTAAPGPVVQDTRAGPAARRASGGTNGGDSALVAPASPVAARRLRPPVHARQNLEEFAPVEAKYVRFTILKANQREPCIDELEIYSAEPNSRNVALASAGAKATASGSFPGYRIHRLQNINDGLYGNDHSWIANVHSNGWVQIELAQKTLINRIVWGRDREGKFVDRLPVDYRISVAVEPGVWKVVASSEDRQPLSIGSQVLINNTSLDQILNRFAPTDTTLLGESRPPLGEYLVDVWQTDQGLPGNAVSSLLQTRDGYLWVGTFNGLARFDGVAFTVFGEGEGLANRRIRCLHEDRKGNLWIGTEGRDLFCYADGTFQRYIIKSGPAAVAGKREAVTGVERRYPYQDSVSEDVIYGIAEDSVGNLWIGSGSALVRLGEDRKFTYYTVQEGLPGQDVHAISEGRQGNLWLVAGGELCQFNQGKFRSFPSAANPFYVSGVSCLFEDRAGRLWVGARNTGLVEMADGRTTVFGEKEGLLPDDMWSLCETRAGDLWLGTGAGGLYRLRGGKFTPFTTQDGLSNNSIRSVYEDQEGNLWIGTNGGGLNRLKRRKLITYTDREGLSHNVVMSLAQDAHTNIWIGLNGGGLNCLRGGITDPFKPETLLNNLYVCSVCPSRDGSLWAGIWSGGLFHLEGDHITSMGLEEGLSDNVILALCEDQAGGIWTGTYNGGLNYFRDGHFRHYGTEEGLSANFVTAILQSQNGALWIGTSGGGLNEFSGAKFKAYTRQQGLGSDFIRTLYEDRQGVLWIGTTGGGLSRFYRGRFTNYTTKEGCLDDVISQILEDNHGYFWIGTNKGIFRVSRQELEAFAKGEIASLSPTFFGKSDGMEGLQCTGGFHPAGLKTRDGRLWFSTVKGLVMADPDKIELNTVPPPVLIEQVLVDGHPVRAALSEGLKIGRRSHADGSVDLGGVGPGEVLHVPARRQRLDFHYTALSFVTPENVRFRYRLEGLEQDWVEAGGLRTAHYSHLPAGDYRFHVLACNNDGVWNRLGSSLALRVIPPWWQTWWFRTLGALALTGIVGGTVRLIELRHLHVKMERLERQHALERERSRIAQDIHDDLGASLTQIALLSQISQRTLSQEQYIAHSRLISDTSRQAIQAMDQIVWAVNPKNDSLDNLANYIPQFAQDFFRMTEVRCRLDVPVSVPEYPMSTDMRHSLFLAVKEALNNIAKHAEATEAWVRLIVKDGFFTIAIEDNGKGFSLASLAERGNGLRNIRKRLESLGGRCELITEPGRGTKVKLVLPLQPAP